MKASAVDFRGGLHRFLQIGQLCAQLGLDGNALRPASLLFGEPMTWAVPAVALPNTLVSSCMLGGVEFGRGWMRAFRRGWITRFLRAIEQKFDLLYLDDPRRKWRGPPGGSFKFHPGWVRLYGAIVPGALVVGSAFLPVPAGGGTGLLTGLAALLGAGAWIGLVELSSGGWHPLGSKDLGKLARAAAEELEGPHQEGSWQITGPQAGALARELGRLNAGLAQVSAVPGLSMEMAKQAWLGENLTPELASNLPAPNKASTGVEPQTVEVEPYVEGDPWPTMEPRNRQWPTWGNKD